MLFSQSKEIAAVTGNYYANGNFEKIVPYLDLAYRQVAKLIGMDIIRKADVIFNKSDKTDEEQEFLKLVQIPVAIKGTLELYRHNDVSHEDTGRKVKIDSEHEKIPWEWQLSHDDELHLEDYYQALDDLIYYLDEKATDEWLSQKKKIGVDELLIPDSDEFSMFWPINSPRIFISLAPLMREAQRRWLIPAMTSDKFNEVKASLSTNSVSSVYPYAANALVLMTMELAFSRGMYSIFPLGIVQSNIGTDGMYKGDTISYNSILNYVHYLHHEAASVLDTMKKEIKGEVSFDLLPKNDPNNQYMRV